jgi:hypothetical protein
MGVISCVDVDVKEGETRRGIFVGPSSDTDGVERLLACE